MRNKKHFILLCLFIMVLGVSTTRAQQDINVNVLGLFFRNYGLGYEYSINEESSFAASFNYVDGFWFDFSNDIIYSDFNITPEYRFYFKPSESTDGFYVGAYIKYQTAAFGDLRFYDDNGKVEFYNLNFNGLALGIETGKKWVSHRGFYFETLFGFGRFIISDWSTSKKNIPTVDFDKNPLYSFDFRMSLNIGWRFKDY